MSERKQARSEIQSVINSVDRAARGVSDSIDDAVLYGMFGHPRGDEKAVKNYWAGLARGMSLVLREV